MKISDKKYSIIYVDPAWEMGEKHKNRVLVPKYNVMQNKDILNLPIKEICSENCALFLWSINAKLPLAIQCINNWGFRYVGIAFCWIKTSATTGMPNCRMAENYTLQGMELCLLGIKGSMHTVDRTVRQVLLSPREYHSKKPDVIRKFIVNLFGDLPRVELFARQKVNGWDAWGDEL
jgi:N6-adenosine-specific RNA methylase IME4